MIEGNLNTTNVLLGIMAAVSVLQTVVLIAAAVVGYRAYGRAMRTIRELEQRHVAPLAAQAASLMGDVERIAADVRDVTGRITRRTERVDTAIDRTIHRVDETADRVRSSVTSSVSQLSGLVHGAWCAIEALFNGRRSSDAAPARPA